MTRFHLGIWNEQLTEETWSATNSAFDVDFVITINCNRKESDPALDDHYREFQDKLKENVISAKAVTGTTWIVVADRTLNELFQLCVNAFGPKYHAYTVVELSSGEGLAFDPVQGVIYEIYPKRNTQGTTHG